MIITRQRMEPSGQLTAIKPDVELTAVIPRSHPDHYKALGELSRAGRYWFGTARTGFVLLMNPARRPGGI